MSASWRVYYRVFLKLAVAAMVICPVTRARAAPPKAGKPPAHSITNTDSAIDPELAEVFPDSKSVNDALRALVAIAARADSRKRA